jgi:hypothetical protein
VSPIPYVNNDKRKDSVVFSLDECIYSHDVNVTVDEIRHCIYVTKCGKVGGPDGLSAECFKFASDKLLIHLSNCFTAMLMHGHTPVTLVEMCHVPIVKNENCDITSPNNYRPIALATVASKILELLILWRCEDKLYTADAQFGFKSDHPTETCIYVLKEILHFYKSRGSPVVICFMDASKAFDRVNHWTLFS